MASLILSNMVASITDLKKHPMATFESAQGESIAILNHNEPVFYCVPAAMYEAMMEVMEDIALEPLIKKRMKEEKVKVNLNDL